MIEKSVKKTSKQQKGTFGEHAALHFLEQKGYILVSQNYRYKRSEIDLICRDGEVLVFVEVKTRKNTSFGFPESFVGESKMKQMYQGAEGYQIEHEWNGPIRFDVVSVMMEDVNKIEVEHFIDVV